MLAKSLSLSSERGVASLIVAMALALGLGGLVYMGVERTTAKQQTVGRIEFRTPQAERCPGVSLEVGGDGRLGSGCP